MNQSQSSLNILVCNMAWLQFYLNCLWFLQAFLFWPTIRELLNYINLEG